MSHAGTQREGLMVRVAVGFTAWAEKWFPDAFIFVAIAVVVVAAAALANGASPLAVSAGVRRRLLEPDNFHDADGLRGNRRIRRCHIAAGIAPYPALAALAEEGGPGAVGLVAAVSILASLINWGLSLIFGGLLVRRAGRTRPN